MAKIKLIQEFDFSLQKLVYRIVDDGQDRRVFQTILRNPKESKEEYDARAEMEFDSLDYKLLTTVNVIKTREV